MIIMFCYYTCAYQVGSSAAPRAKCDLDNAVLPNFKAGGTFDSNVHEASLKKRCPSPLTLKS